MIPTYGTLASWALRGCTDNQSFQYYLSPVASFNLHRRLCMATARLR